VNLIANRDFELVEILSEGLHVYSKQFRRTCIDRAPMRRSIESGSLRSTSTVRIIPFVLRSGNGVVRRLSNQFPLKNQPTD
jgi:hypothetical protein